MKRQNLFISVLFITLIAGCNPLKQMQTHQTSISEAYNAENYEQVLIAFNQLENYHETEESNIQLNYVKMAAKSAIKLDRYQFGEELLQRWLDKSKDPEAIELLASIYTETGKTDKEYEHWKIYLNTIESEERKKEIQTRLFVIEMKRKEYEDALERANKMPPLSDPRIMSMRMEALEETGKKDEARKLCETILEKHPDYEPAMEWKAIDIYERAESWYKSEMSKYNENADYTAYVYLRRELKKISAMYRESRDIFEKLHQNNPGNTQYIKYLKNIYLRLEMREEATKMDMLLENQ